MSENLEIKSGQNVVCNENDNTYVIKLKSHKNLWWLLLLLLPMLLLIKCNKDITVSCINGDSNNFIPDQNVNLNYTAHFLWNGGFLKSDSINITQKTDENGKTIFKNLPFSVFSYIFYHSSIVKAYATESNCFSACDTSEIFHSTDKIDLFLNSVNVSFKIKLVDLENGNALADGNLEYKYYENGNEIFKQLNADENGFVEIKNISRCANLNLIASCVDHFDTSKVDILCVDLIDNNCVMKLRPIKQEFTFFVKDKKAKTPIENASAKVTITKTDGTSSTLQLKTNNQGAATVKNVDLKSTISIHASKTGYKDGDLENAPYIIQKFITQPEDIRTVWLEPKENPTPKPQPPLQGETGDLRFNLQWYCKADLDLIVKDPCGNVTFYNKKTTNCRGSVGKLDIDANQNATNEPWKASTKPQENTFWKNPSEGTYTVYIVCCPFHPQMNLKSRYVDFNLTIQDKHGTQNKAGKITEHDSLFVISYKFVK
ncbi:MAG: hypothetical protein MJ211_03240 [Bacteroidales bacterium]|nr:hypothetical protein [Bacteroidales bacterium]